mmetsp:Transcript_15331/g.48974  ORF Transcript_15331/g.48974 Transcript_15331/m.48974 type:complete len:238 (-) Transcript_15331:294-1007(-)
MCRQEGTTRSSCRQAARLSTARQHTSPRGSRRRYGCTSARPRPSRLSSRRRGGRPTNHARTTQAGSRGTRRATTERALLRAAPADSCSFEQARGGGQRPLPHAARSASRRHLGGERFARDGRQRALHAAAAHRPARAAHPRSREQQVPHASHARRVWARLPRAADLGGGAGGGVRARVLRGGGPSTRRRAAGAAAQGGEIDASLCRGRLLARADADAARARRVAVARKHRVRHQAAA